MAGIIRYLKEKAPRTVDLGGADEVDVQSIPKATVTVVNPHKEEDNTWEREGHVVFVASASENPNDRRKVDMDASIVGVVTRDLIQSLFVGLILKIRHLYGPSDIVLIMQDALKQVADYMVHGTTEDMN